MIHTDVSKRHDFVLLFDVTNGNPNGDPDAGNRPRTDPETGQGLVTDVCLKRKIRDYAACYQQRQIFVQSRTSLNNLIVDAFKKEGVQIAQVTVENDDVCDWLRDNVLDDFALEGNVLIYGGESAKAKDIEKKLLEPLDLAEEGAPVLKRQLSGIAQSLARNVKSGISEESRDKARDRMCRDYFDVRMFGAVLSTGLNAGQVRGPVQLTFATSIDPVVPIDYTITRQARTTEARMETGKTEMGRKAQIPYGLYRAHGFFNPYFAQQTGVADADLELLWQAVGAMFDLDRSAARGEMATCGLYAFSHDSPLGNAPARQLFNRIRIERSNGSARSPRSFADYSVTVDADSLPAGVTLTTLVG